MVSSDTLKVIGGSVGEGCCISRRGAICSQENNSIGRKRFLSGARKPVTFVTSAS